jgi:fimbrial chaperone protein
MKIPTCSAIFRFGLVAWVFVSTASVAGSLTVSPVRIDLSVAQRSVALTVQNDGDQSAVVQTELMSWSQAENADRLDPTNDLIASPPIFTVAPGTSQIVRVALRRAPDSANETPYRILINEVPGPPQPGFTGAQFALKISLPIFVAATTATSPRVQWSAVRGANGGVELALVNAGAKHIQVQRIELAGASADADAKFAGLLYVLPGQRRSVTLKPEPGHTIASGRIRIKAETDAGPLDADVALEKP